MEQAGLGVAMQQNGGGAECTVAISPLLRRLRGLRGMPEPRAENQPGHPSAPAVSAGFREPASSALRAGLPSPAPPLENSAAAPHLLGPAADIRLRCDGARPLRFSGALLLRRQRVSALKATTSCAPRGDPAVASASAQYARARHRFELFATRSGEVVAAIMLDFHGAIPARPLHRAAPIASGAALVRFLRAFDPAEALVHADGAAQAPGNPDGAPLGRLEALTQASTLRAAFADMIASAGLSMTEGVTPRIPLHQAERRSPAFSSEAGDLPSRARHAGGLSAALPAATNEP